MLISRTVTNPRLSLPNKAGRTTGVYGHLPRFWSCKGEDYDTDNGAWKYYGYDERPDWHIKVAEEQKAFHANCKLPHINLPGYVRLLTKKRMYTFWYTGNPYRHKLFESGQRRSGRLT